MKNELDDHKEEIRNFMSGPIIGLIRQLTHQYSDSRARQGVEFDETSMLATPPLPEWSGQPGSGGQHPGYFSHPSLWSINWDGYSYYSALSGWNNTGSLMANSDFSYVHVRSI